MDLELLKQPLHSNQHGFQKRKSTETALSKTINTIESYTDKKKYCVGVFLDIQVAFDTISPQYIKTCLEKHVSGQDLIDWYDNYLTHRNLKAIIGDYEGEVSNNIGFPQGGVCSVKF